MSVGKFLLAAAAVSMTVSPALAAPAATAKVERASTKVDKDSKLGGSGFIIAALAAAAVVAGIIIVADEDDSPDSN